jgi:hypothetical protein
MSKTNKITEAASIIIPRQRRRLFGGSLREPAINQVANTLSKKTAYGK